MFINIFCTELMNTVSASAEQTDDGVKVIFTFPEVVSPQLQEIAAAEVGWPHSSLYLAFSVQWTAQSRSKRNNLGWKWAPLPPAAFRNGTLIAETVLTDEKSRNIEVSPIEAVNDWK